MPNTQTANGNPVSGSGGQAFNPNVIQNATSGSTTQQTSHTGGGLLGTVLGLAKTVVMDLVGLLHDAAGAFDLLDVPSVNPTHPSGCGCPNCRQAATTQQTASAVEDSLLSNPSSTVSVAVQGQSDGQAAANSQTGTPFFEVSSTDRHASGDSSLGSSISGLAESQQWSNECEAYFAEQS
jgi:hypothetical protein